MEYFLSLINFFWLLIKLSFNIPYFEYTTINSLTSRIYEILKQEKINNSHMLWLTPSVYSYYGSQME